MCGLDEFGFEGRKRKRRLTYAAKPVKSSERRSAQGLHGQNRCSSAGVPPSKQSASFVCGDIRLMDRDYSSSRSDIEPKK